MQIEGGRGTRGGVEGGCVVWEASCSNAPSPGLEDRHPDLEMRHAGAASDRGAKDMVACECFCMRGHAYGRGGLGKVWQDMGEILRG